MSARARDSCEGGSERLTGRHARRAWSDGSFPLLGRPACVLRVSLKISDACEAITSPRGLAYGHVVEGGCFIYVSGIAFTVVRRVGGRRQMRNTSREEAAVSAAFSFCKAGMTRKALQKTGAATKVSEISHALEQPAA